jgi:hypothetical protein
VFRKNGQKTFTLPICAMGAQFADLLYHQNLIDNNYGLSAALSYNIYLKRLIVPAENNIGSLLFKLYYIC